MSDQLFDCLIGLMRLFSLATKKIILPKLPCFCLPLPPPKISVTHFTLPGVPLGAPGVLSETRLLMYSHTITITVTEEFVVRPLQLVRWRI